jgi:hypothetical protein
MRRLRAQGERPLQKVKETNEAELVAEKPMQKAQILLALPFSTASTLTGHP